MQNLIALAAEPATWAALATLTVLEVVLGIDNLVFVAILSNKLPAHLRHRARRIGMGNSERMTGGRRVMLGQSEGGQGPETTRSG